MALQINSSLPWHYANSQSALCNASRNQIKVMKCKTEIGKSVQFNVFNFNCQIDFEDKIVKHHILFQCFSIDYFHFYGTLENRNHLQQLVRHVCDLCLNTNTSALRQFYILHDATKRDPVNVKTHV